MASINTLTGNVELQFDLSNPDTIVLGGEVNTASNVGAGIGLFNQKNIWDLEFKSLSAGDGISIRNDGLQISISSSATSYQQLRTNRLEIGVTSATSGLFNFSNIGILFTSGSITAVLPSHTAGAQYIVKTIGSCSATLSASFGLIDNQITQVITTPFSALSLASNGTNWYII